MQNYEIKNIKAKDRQFRYRLFAPAGNGLSCEERNKTLYLHLLLASGTPWTSKNCPAGLYLVAFATGHFPSEVFLGSDLRAPKPSVLIFWYVRPKSSSQNHDQLKKNPSNMSWDQPPLGHREGSPKGGWTGGAGSVSAPHWATKGEWGAGC